jgi:hypothetical protein
MGDQLVARHVLQYESKLLLQCSDFKQAMTSGSISLSFHSKQLHLIKCTLKHAAVLLLLRTVDYEVMSEPYAWHQP